MGWLSGWDYRKSHEIQGSNVGAQTNYQVKIIVHKGSGTDSGEHVYCNNHCQDDFGDIRFTDSDGTTLLDYWMEEYTSGDKATFWVEIPSIPASPDTATIYIYYGKSDATTTSNGDDTFLFFDDFTGDLSEWTQRTGSWAIDSSDDTLYCSSDYGSAPGNIITCSYSGTDYAIETKVKLGSGTNADGNSVARYNANGYFYRGDAYAKEGYEKIRIQKWTGSYTTLASQSFDYSPGDIIRFSFRISDTTIKAYDLTNNITISTTDSAIPNGYTGCHCSIGFTTSPKWYWFAVRKYVEPEPSHGSWGSEEQSEATEVAITDSATGVEALSRLYRDINLTDIATSQESFSRPYRQLQIPEQASSNELLLKTRNLSLGDIATSLEIIQKARQIGAITDTAQSLEQILKQRFTSLLDAATGGETIARPTRMTILADEALSQEILSKLRELTAVTDSAIGIEYVNIGTEGAVKTKIFLLIGDLAIQVTGD